jgi:hypothetical protein
VGSTDQESRVGIPLTVLTLQHFCACPKPGSGLSLAYVFFSVQWFEVRGS